MHRLSLLHGNGFAVSGDLNPELVSVDALKALGRQTRKHPHAQIRKLGESPEQFGFVLPIVVDADNRVVVGCLTGMKSLIALLSRAKTPAFRRREFSRKGTTVQRG